MLPISQTILLHWHATTGALISESFSLQASKKKVPNHDPEHCPPKEKMVRVVIWHLFVGDLSRGEICSEIKPPLYAILGWKWFQSFVTLVFAEWGRVNSQFQKKSVHSSRSLSMTHMSVPLVKAPNNREKSTWRPSINNLSNFFVGAGREDQQILERWCLKEVKNE